MTLEGPDDEVVSLDLVDETTTLLTVTDNGFGKRTEYSQYPAHRRGGKGVITIVTNLRNGFVSNVKSVAEDDERMFTSAEGIIIRIPAKDISIQGRNTQGVRVMNIKPGDKVSGMARIKNGNEDEKLKQTALAKKVKQKIPDTEDEEEDVEDLEEFEDIEDADEFEEQEMDTEEEVEDEENEENEEEKY
ncbi:DNA gyrase subunit A [bioreactor metagenome]|uniref:DNA gyrase subunit A n=1 Tax=bioreactor metagenome TaxID=1076179 RepID=A0A645CNJ7_9ZZZZ